MASVPVGVEAVNGLPGLSEAPAGAGGGETALPSEYEITIEKRPPEKTSLGLDLDFRDMITLEIENIMEGLVLEWNNANKEALRVRTGDRVVEVNGISAKPGEMVAQIREAAIVKMKIRRAI